VQIGTKTIIHSGCVIGSDGFGNANDQGAWVKIQHLGTVIVGDDVEIGANTTIDRGALQNTVIENNVRIDNLVQIAHNVHIGAHTAIAGCVGIAGSAKIGKYCMIGGAAGINGHITICDKAIVMGMAMVTSSITTPGVYGSGTGLMSRNEWLRAVMRLRQLDELFSRVKALEYISGRGLAKVFRKFFELVAKIKARFSEMLLLKKYKGK
jgi:UDP-3-O-[3-hydroxymyristoyl] glucosamine N-acyltransferase